MEDVMTLTEFLLARIGEDEVAARGGMSEPQYGGAYGDTAAEEVLWMGNNEGVASEGMEHFERWLPSRVLAECEAKRRIVKFHACRPVYDGPTTLLDPICKECGSGEPYEYPVDWPCRTLKVLALPYADDADYQEAWRP